MSSVSVSDQGPEGLKNKIFHHKNFVNGQNNIDSPSSNINNNNSDNSNNGTSNINYSKRLKTSPDNFNKIIFEEESFDEENFNPNFFAQNKNLQTAIYNKRIRGEPNNNNNYNNSNIYKNDYQETNNQKDQRELVNLKNLNSQGSGAGAGTSVNGSPSGSASGLASSSKMNLVETEKKLSGLPSQNIITSNNNSASPSPSSSDHNLILFSHNLSEKNNNKDGLNNNTPSDLNESRSQEMSSPTNEISIDGLSVHGSYNDNDLSSSSSSNHHDPLNPLNLPLPLHLHNLSKSNPKLINSSNQNNQNNSVITSSSSSSVSLSDISVLSESLTVSLNSLNSQNSNSNTSNSAGFISSLSSVLAPFDQYFIDEMFEKEKSFQPNVHYFNFHQDLDPSMRPILIDWIMEVCQEFSLGRECFHLSVNYIDRYLSVPPSIPFNDISFTSGILSELRFTNRCNLQLLGVACLSLASKLEEIYSPTAMDFASTTDGAFDVRQIQIMEKHVLGTLRWSLHAPTGVNWLKSIIKLVAQHVHRDYLNLLANCNSLEEKMQFNSVYLHTMSNLLSTSLFERAMILIDLATLDLSFLRFYPSAIASSAFILIFTRPSPVRCPSDLVMNNHLPEVMRVFNLVGYLESTTGYSSQILTSCISSLVPFFNIPPTDRRVEKKNHYEDLKIPNEEIFLRQVHYPNALMFTQQIISKQKYLEQQQKHFYNGGRQ